MTNKERFLQLVSQDETPTMAYIRERIENRAQIRKELAEKCKHLDELREGKKKDILTL